MADNLTYVITANVVVSALPLEWPASQHFQVVVKWSGIKDGKYLYAVAKAGHLVLNSKNTWDWDRTVSERDDEWLTEHRFTYEEALERAEEVVHTITVNGYTVKDALENGPEWY